MGKLDGRVWKMVRRKEERERERERKRKREVTRFKAEIDLNCI